MVKKCGYCDKVLTGQKRRWCSNHCNSMYYNAISVERKKKRAKENRPNLNKGQAHAPAFRHNGRPYHLKTLCFQDGECANYYNGHQVIRATREFKEIGDFTGCMGKTMYKKDGSCFVKQNNLYGK